MLRFLNKENYTVLSDQILSTRHFFLLLILIFFSVPPKLFANQENNIDSLLQELAMTSENSIRADLMFKIAREYYYTDIHQSIDYAQKAHKLFSLANDKIALGQCINLEGAGYFALGEYKKAYPLFRSALKYAQQARDTLQTAKILNNLGNIKLNTGYLTEAIKFYKEAGTIFTESNQTNGAIAIENSIASIYRTIGSYSKSHEHLQRALTLANSTQNQLMAASVYQNISALYSEEEKYQEALEAGLKSYRIRTEENNPTQIVKTLITLGSIFYETKKYKEADTCYKKALRLSRNFGYIEEKAYTFMHLGYLNLKTMELGSAQNYLDSSLFLARKLHDQELELQLHDYLFFIDSTQGKYSSAIAHLQVSNALQESLSLSETDSKLKELETILDLSKQENHLQEKTIAKSHKIIFILVISILLLVLLTILIIQQILLRSQRKTAELTQDNLRSQMNPHFIFNILNSIHSYILKNDTKSSTSYLIKFSNLLRQTLDNSVNKLVSIEDELNALKLYLELESLRLDNKLEYSIFIDDEIDPIMFKIPTLLLQPYVENSILHGLQQQSDKSNRTGKIEINLKYNNNSILCTITDNGIGREKAEALKTQNGIKRKSHGSTITETRLKLLNSIYGKKIGVKYADILDENNNCLGTRVEFNLPILN
jgi:tetratricopeptide (TPR) repeat protein